MLPGRLKAFSQSGTYELEVGSPFLKFNWFRPFLGLGHIACEDCRDGWVDIRLDLLRPGDGYVLIGERQVPGIFF